MILNVAGPYWLPAQLAFQFYPTVLLLVAIAAVQVKSPKDERQVREMLRGYEPEEVSYAFERTWG